MKNCILYLALVVCGCAAPIEIRVLEWPVNPGELMQFVCHNSTKQVGEVCCVGDRFYCRSTVCSLNGSDYYMTSIVCNAE